VAGLLGGAHPAPVAPATAAVAVAAVMAGRLPLAIAAAAAVLAGAAGADARLAALGPGGLATAAGEAIEEIVFAEITTGASNDLEKVTATAKQMVMRFGMSDKLGPRVFGHDHGQPFLGREFSAEPDYSDEIAREIDDEIRRIVEGAHQQAKDILLEHREQLTTISELLLKRETIEREEFEALLEGKTEADVFDVARVLPLHPGKRRLAAAAHGR
jgi:cell division protease FtsH